jgi:hypothetical protein
MCQRVGEADLVVVARVLGPVDARVDGNGVRRRELYRVRVVRTLSGSDVAGWDLRLRPPSSGPWASGGSYILFLTQPYFGGARAVHLDVPALPASTRAVMRVVNEVAQCDRQVRPEPAFWVYVLPGWRPTPQLHVRVLADGTYLLRRPDPSGEIVVQRGQVAMATLEPLVAAARRLPESPVVDDATTLEIGWTAGGDVHRKTVRGGAGKTVQAFVETIERKFLQTGE